MEKKLSPFDLEYMKLAMLKQESIFKHQLYELHRLYRIQNLLMTTTTQRKNFKNEDIRVPNEKKKKKKMRNLLCELERPSRLHDRIGDDQNDDDINEGVVDLTLGLGTCYNNIQDTSDDDTKKMCVKGMLTYDSVMSFSSSSIDSSNNSKKTCIRRSDGVEYHDHWRQQDGKMLDQTPWLLQST